MKNYLKINYIESILIVIAFITINFFNIIMRKFLAYIELPESIIFSISYAVPFILLFLFISNQAQRKNLIINLSVKLSPWYIYIIIFLMMLIVITLNECLASLIPKDNPVLENMYKEIEFFLKEEIKNPIPFLSTTVLLAPICEEVLFRGIILNGLLKNKVHPLKAILFSSFLFGLTHMNPWQLVGGLFIGSFIGYIYFVTQSIIDCILLHIFNNALATVGIFYSFNNSITEDSNQYNIYFLISSGLLLLLGSYFLFRRKKKYDASKNF